MLGLASARNQRGAPFSLHRSSDCSGWDGRGWTAWAPAPHRSQSLLWRLHRASRLPADLESAAGPGQSSAHRSCCWACLRATSSSSRCAPSGHTRSIPRSCARFLHLIPFTPGPTALGTRRYRGLNTGSFFRTRVDRTGAGCSRKCGWLPGTQHGVPLLEV